MRVLSVLQPWAWAIVHGPKRVENRSWRTDYRGPLLIHAGKSRSLLDEDYSDLPMSVPDASRLTFGAIIGECQLVDCVPGGDLEDDPFAFGPWCWVLEGVRAIQPFPCRGSLGLFRPPADFTPSR